MREDRITEASIRRLVDTFYSKVRADSTLNPIFSQAIGADPKAWEPHMQKMYDFWSSVMISGGRYQGNPLQKHRNLPTFDIKLFDRWLALFEETARQLHTEEIANHFVEKSKRIAESLKLGLYPTLPKSEK
ncbi:MAG: group III truncated hemoglobin [Alphaproteobacteria bacterium]|nr:group III truncated hemoglobin [Alphaproteobacteria bacterium]